MTHRTLRGETPLLRALAVFAAVAVLGAAWSPAAGASLRFSDVPDSNVFSADIDWLASRGVTAGCNPPANDRFCPDDPVTRGQMAAFLVRALNLDKATTSFDDTAGSVFEADIAALANAGITKGCNPPDNTRFCPNDPVTRGQMAAFVRRALPDLPAVVTAGANVIGATDSTYQPSISDDGRWVAYTVYDEANGSAIRVVDRDAATHKDLRPGPGGYYFTHPALSGDGNWVLTYASTTDDKQQLWLVNRSTGAHHVIDGNLNYGGPQDSVDINFDGRYVVFTTANPDRMAEPSGSSEMFRFDRMTKSYDPLSVDSAGDTPEQGAIGWGRISADGSKVMFESNQPNMAADTPTHPNVYPTYLYVHDFATGTTELVSRDEFGDPVESVLYSAFSGDGTTVAYFTDDGYVIRQLGSLVLQAVPEPDAVVRINRTTLSSDGTVLAYFAETSSETATYQLYAFDADANRTRLLSKSASGEPANQGALANTFYPGRPALTANGTWAAFTSTSTNLGAAPPSSGVAAAHVFVTEAS